MRWWSGSGLYLFCGTSDQALMQPKSLFLRETLSLVIPQQSPLDLRGTQERQTDRARERILINDKEKNTDAQISHAVMWK